MTEAISDELLMAYADGELDADSRERIARALEERRDLQERLHIFERTGRQLGQAYQTVPRPVPAVLQERGARRPVAARRGGIAELLQTWAQASLNPAWAAASLILIAGLTGLFMWKQPASMSQGDAPFIYTASGGIEAGGILRAALETAVSAPDAGDGGSAAAVVQSFVTLGGDYCREYRAAGGRGIACRSDDRAWRVVLHSASEREMRGSAGQFTPAGVEASQIVDSFVHQVMAGDPLTAGAEKAAIASGWQRSSGR